MKRIFAAMLALCLCAALLPACAEGTAPVVITFWHSATEKAGEAVNRYVADFNDTVGRENGIRVEAVYQGSYAESVTKMNSMLGADQTDQLPDVMQMDATGKAVYAGAGAAWTVDRMLAEFPETDVSAMLPAAAANWNLAGVQLGLPFATSTTVTYYNKTLFDAAQAQPVDTLADIAALAGVLPAAAADGSPLTIYACVPNTPTLANWLGQIGSDLVNGSNGSEAAADALACMDNGALVRFLAAWKALYASGALSNTNGSKDAFAAGTLAVMTSSSSNVANILAAVGGRFEVGVSAYPRMSEDAAAGASVSGSCLVMFDHGDAARRAAARLFTLYLTSPDVQADFAMSTGYVPSNVLSEQSGAWKAFVAENPLYAVALEQILATPDTMRSVTVGPSADFYYAVMNDISDMLENDQTPEETAEIMQEDLEGMLNQYLRANP